MMYHRSLRTMMMCLKMSTVLWLFKPIGWTPYQCIKYIKETYGLDRTISDMRVAYAGRLDPMACGIMPIVIAPKKKMGSICEKLQGSYKTYTFNVCMDVRTDTYDILGIPCLNILDEGPIYSLSEIRNKKTQKYPIYSSKNNIGPDNK